MAIFIGRIISSVTGDGLTLLGDALETIGNMLFGLVDMFSAFAKGDVEKGLSILLEDVLKSLIVGLATLIVDLMLLVAGAIETVIPSLGTTLTDAITGLKDQVTGTVIAPEVGVTPVLSVVSTSQDKDFKTWLTRTLGGRVGTEESMLSGFESILELDVSTRLALTGTGTAQELATQWIDNIEAGLTTESNPEARQRLIGVAKTLAEMYAIPFNPEVASTADPQEIVNEFMLPFVTAFNNAKTNPLMTALQSAFSGTTTTTEGVDSVGKTYVQQTVDDMQAEADALAGTVDLTALATGLADSETSPSTYITTQLKPLEAEFIRIFGEQGTVTTLYKNFVSGFALDTVMLQTSMNGLLASTATVFTLLVGTITIAVSLIIGKLDDLKAKIDQVAGALGGLNTTMQAVPVVGGTGGNGGSGGGGGNKTVNIYGASSYQQIANEASRQGVPLVGKPSRV
jgi:hypothetical protein